MAAMIPTFETVGGATIAELCLGFAFLRGAGLPLASSEIGGWFELAVSETDLGRSVSRMVERGWLQPHPARVGGYLLTDAGEEIVEQAFKGFVRFIDAGENRWDVGMMFQIARTHYDRRRN
jgi:DNA-binding transcriptional regulator PaaX